MLHIKEIELNQLMRISEACLSPVPIQTKQKSCRQCFFFFSSPGSMDFCDRLGSWSAKEQQQNKIVAIVDEDVVSIVAMSGPS